MDLPVAGIILGLVTAAYLDAFAIGFDLPLLLCCKLLHPSVHTSPPEQPIRVKADNITGIMDSMFVLRRPQTDFSSRIDQSVTITFEQ